MARELQEDSWHGGGEIPHSLRRRYESHSNDRGLLFVWTGEAEQQSYSSNRATNFTGKNV